MINGRGHEWKFMCCLSVWYHLISSNICGDKLLRKFLEDLLGFVSSEYNGFLKTFWYWVNRKILDISWSAPTHPNHVRSRIPSKCTFCMWWNGKREYNWDNRPRRFLGTIDWARPSLRSLPIREGIIQNHWGVGAVWGGGQHQRREQFHDGNEKHL